MKLAHYLLNHPIEWKDYYVNTFVIENSVLYRDFLLELCKQLKGEDGGFVLSDGLEILNFSKNVEIIANLIDLGNEIDKKISTAIIKDLNEIAINDYYVDTLELYQKINELVSNLIFKSDQDLMFDEINDMSQLLKLYNVRPDYSEMTFAEKLLFYMELCEKYLKKKLFVIANLHSFFTKEEQELLFKSFVYRQYKVFIVERYDVKALELEQKRIIDIDLCEI